MAQKHLQLLRNGSAFTDYNAAYTALISKGSYADGTPILARYTDNEDHQKTLLGVVNNGTVDVINNVSDYLLRNYTAFADTATTITADDDVKTAIAKLEKHIQDVAADITVTVEEAQDANTQAHLDITATTSTTEGDTYTIGLKDVASESALTQEISDRESGDTALSNRLGDGVTAANTATAQLTALSGNNSSTSAETSVEGAKRYADEKTRASLDALDTNSVSGESMVVIDVTQKDGKISATTANLTGVKLGGYAEGTDADIAATDTLGQALGKLQAQINAMDKDADVVAGQVVTTVAEADGKVTETKANVKDLQLGGYVKNASATGAISGTDTVSDALSKLENTVTANKIANADGSINVTTAASGTDINVNIKSGEHVLAKGGNAGLYTNIAISSVTGTELTDLGTNVKEAYKLVGTDNTKLGEYIKIYKDSSISKIYLGYPTDTVDSTSGVITSGATGEAQSLNYVYHKEDGTYEMVHVDVSKFLVESEFASGVTADANGVVHGVVDSTSEEDESNNAFLTVGANGFKVDGIKAAIDTKINKLDVTGDTAVAGQYVAAIQETDGIVAVKERANVSDAVLTGYAKGTKPASTAIAATDDVKGAIAKLEHQVDAAKAAATTKVEKDAAASHLTLTSSTAADGSVTYTIGESDIASKTDLDAEIAARKAVDGVNGNAYTADTNANYISGARNLYEADQALDTSLKALNDETIKTITSTNTGCTVTVSGEGNTRNIAVNTDGGQVQLTGYKQGSNSGAPAATDSVNAAIAKLYNRTLATEVRAGSATTVSQASTGTTVDVKLDTTSDIAEYNAAHAQAVNAKSKNVLEITPNGLYLNNNWDCGTY